MGEVRITFNEDLDGVGYSLENEPESHLVLSDLLKFLHKNNEKRLKEKTFIGIIINLNYLNFIFSIW